ncbi:MAG: hypothetical protein AAGH53_08320 [Pseudomonadota bacterium]
MNLADRLTRFSRWTLTQPLAKLFALSILFQAALVASFFLRNDTLFYTGIVGSWCLIILFLMRQTTAIGDEMRNLEAGQPQPSYGRIIKLLAPFMIHFGSFAILSTIVGLAYRA